MERTAELSLQDERTAMTSSSSIWWAPGARTSIETVASACARALVAARASVAGIHSSSSRAPT
jgi:hypothetical protein